MDNRIFTDPDSDKNIEYSPLGHILRTENNHYADLSDDEKWVFAKFDQMTNIEKQAENTFRAWKYATQSYYEDIETTDWTPQKAPKRNKYIYKHNFDSTHCP